MKKVLITGATGFVGGHLTDYLAAKKEFEIFGTSLTDSLKNDKIQIEKIDLTDFNQVLSLIQKIKPDQIYHLAALTSPGESFTKSTQVVLSNISIEMNLLNAMREIELISTRFLVVSSAEVYGMVPKSDLPIDENTPLRPSNPYAVSKIAQDYLGLQYVLSYKFD
ncbi:MAG TPA: GDP-mannose 4,6-dehydratase, partial [Candidatus Saccharimonadales bacterium]|nr:GDP-mannose 4,6-dehydratase [Candidatus Saccharimonadales bacterium]